jgi:hypothetical protein
MSRYGLVRDNRRMKKMDRRAFLTSLLGVAGAAASIGLTAREAKAAPLFEELKAVDRLAPDADLPAPDAQAAWHRGFPHRGWGPRRRWRPRRCVVRRNRFGRIVRVCRL